MFRSWGLVVCAALYMLAGCATSAHQYNRAYSLTQEKSSNSSRGGVARQTSSKKTPISLSSIGDVSCSHVVQKGDTLYSLAFVNNMELSELAALNGIPKPYHINVGQRLTLGCKNQQKTSQGSFISASSSVPKKTMIHVVLRGETLFSISKKHGLTVAYLRKLNNLHSNQIEVGQHLVIRRGTASSSSTGTVIANNTSSAPGMRTTAAASNTSVPSSPKPTASPSLPSSSSSSRKLAWQWPTSSGKIIQNFSTGEHGNKGIDISATRGSPVKSAAGGKVVYAGNALRGYGNLIIINHNDDYLSAYAHNDSILVNEGAEVKSGEVIARMGDTEADSVRLHFEIRYRGQSVNPLSYLPARK